MSFEAYAGTSQRFERRGILAIDPKALLELHIVPNSRATRRVGAVDVIDVKGPLTQRAEMWADSYDSIRERFTVALSGDARAVVMRFDSPGGDASGCFEAAKAMRVEALASGKPFFAYIDKACSAAYALATAATHGVAIGESCCAGSIGVMSGRTDATAQNVARGLRFAFVTSGRRKLDGNPDFPITDEELAEAQTHVDTLAGVFFNTISAMRPPLTAAAVAAWDGGVFYGERALRAGLADAVATFEELLAFASSGGNMQVLAKASGNEYQEARALLEKAAKGDDANAAAAKRALAALGETDPGDETDAAPDANKNVDPSSESADDEPAAEGDDDKPEAEGDDKKPEAASGDDKPAASSSVSELTLAAKVQRLEAQLASEKDARIRRGLLAKRPDFGAEVRAVLRKVPIAQLREAVETWPVVGGEAVAASSTVAKPGEAKPRPAPITTVGATRAESQTSKPQGAARTSAQADLLDLRMGFVDQKLGCRREGATLFFGLGNSSEEPGNGAA